MKIETLKRSHKKEIIIGVLVVIAIVATITMTTSKAKYRTTQVLPLVEGVVNYTVPDLRIVSIKISEDGENYTDTEDVPTSGYTLNTSKSICRVFDGTTTPEEAPIDNNITLEYVEGKINVKDVSRKNTRCYLYFDKYVPTASETLIATGNLVNENGYRYQGSNPNNYVTFNNELWRIIGVFDTTVVDETTNEQKQEQLIKIIKNESIGDIAWNSSGSNDWTTASLKTLLNEGDYYTRNGSYSSNGLTEEAKQMIENVIWNLGGSGDSSATADGFYSAERGSTGANGTTNASKLKWTGKVGLMYPSDYGYAVPASTCARTTTLNKYNNSGCSTNNWLYKSSYDQWMITPSSSNSSLVFTVTISSSVNHYYAFYGCGASPSVYLKSSVKITDGDGSNSSPYVLS